MLHNIIPKDVIRYIVYPYSLYLSIESALTCQCKIRTNDIFIVKNNNIYYISGNELNHLTGGMINVLQIGKPPLLKKLDEVYSDTLFQYIYNKKIIRNQIHFNESNGKLIYHNRDYLIFMKKLPKTKVIFINTSKMDYICEKKLYCDEIDITCNKDILYIYNKTYHTITSCKIKSDNLEKIRYRKINNIYKDFDVKKYSICGIVYDIHLDTANNSTYLRFTNNESHILIEINENLEMKCKKEINSHINMVRIEEVYYCGRYIIVRDPFTINIMYNNKFIHTLPIEQREKIIFDGNYMHFAIKGVIAEQLLVTSYLLPSSEFY